MKILQIVNFVFKMKKVNLIEIDFNTGFKRKEMYKIYNQRTGGNKHFG